jgi:hypothetical protein
MKDVVVFLDSRALIAITVQLDAAIPAPVRAVSGREERA